MNQIKRGLLAGAAAAIAAATAAAVVPGAVASASSAVTPQTASTQVSNRPDGGNHDADNGPNTAWANDNFKRVVSVTREGQVTRASCAPGSTPITVCFSYRYTITDTGTFTTNPTASSGAFSPQAGKTLDTAVTGKFSGGTTRGVFFASAKAANSSLVPAAEDDMGSDPSGEQTTTNWPEQFFPAGTVFNSVANPGGPDLGPWRWSYTLGFGSNKACPNDAYRWVDSAANGGGATPPDGDILAPDASDCI